MKYKNTIFITIIILAVISFVSISIFGFIKISNMEQEISKLLKDIREFVQIIDSEDEAKPEIKELRLITPNGDEQLCLGDNFIIKWETPPDVQAVTLIVRKAGAAPINSFTIGVYPTLLDKEKELGTGNFTWEVGKVESRYGSIEKPEPLLPGLAYEMFVKATSYNQLLTDGSDKIFSISDCKK